LIEAESVSLMSTAQVESGLGLGAKPQPTATIQEGFGGDGSDGIIRMNGDTCSVAGSIDPAETRACTLSCEVNGIKDGTETAVDCGGSACLPCADELACLADSDCTYRNCEDGFCTPSCTNGISDGTETDVDCGGFCAPCGDGKACSSYRDCLTGDCIAGMCDPTACPPSPGVVAALHFVELHPTDPYYIALRNDHPSCAADIAGLNLVWHADYFWQYARALPSYVLNAGDTLFLWNDTPAIQVDDIDLAISSFYPPDWVMICEPPCDEMSAPGVVDFIGMNGVSSLPYPWPVEFYGPLPDLTNYQDRSYIRAATNTVSPSFSFTDWTLGPKTR
jgi:hypothetical protein